MITSSKMKKKRRRRKGEGRKRKEERGREKEKQQDWRGKEGKERENLSSKNEENHPYSMYFTKVIKQTKPR